MSFDVRAVREHFPALKAGYAHFDGPGGSQVPDVVIEAMGAHFERGTANDGGAFATSRQTAELVAAARVAAGALTGSDPEEITFGANMTTLNFLLAHAVAGLPVA